MTATTTKRITLEWLRSQGAFPEHLDLFRKGWGESAEITPENLRKAIDRGLNVIWLAPYLFSDQELVDFEQALAPTEIEYSRKFGAVKAEYDWLLLSLWDKRDLAIKQLEAPIDELKAKCSQAVEQLWRDREQAIKPIRDKYWRDAGNVFGKMLFGPDAWGSSRGSGSEPITRGA